MRDYFDVWTLSRQFDFDGDVLTAAVHENFGRRGLRIPSEPVALTGAFSRDPTKQSQWRGFVWKSRLEDVEGDLEVVVGGIAEFIGPVIRALHDGESSKVVGLPRGRGSTSSLAQSELRAVPEVGVGTPSPAFPSRSLRCAPHSRMPTFHYVYILIRERDPDRHYVGITTDLRERLNRHNSGRCSHTTDRRPWRIETAIAFRT
jgi:hypothetical protein